GRNAARHRRARRQSPRRSELRDRQHRRGHLRQQQLRHAHLPEHVPGRLRQLRNNTGDGSYNFVVNQANTNFLLGTEHLDLVYTYKVQDAAGATSVALLNIRINGADDLAQANADTGSMTEDSSATIFSVEANDNLDPDHDAANTISLGAVTVGSAAA